MPNSHNDNHVIIETDRAGREHPVLAPLPEPVHILLMPGETMTDSERAMLERFLRAYPWQRRRAS